MTDKFTNILCPISSHPVANQLLFQVMSSGLIAILLPIIVIKVTVTNSMTLPLT